MADYQTWLPEFKQLNIAIIAASVDPLAEAQKTVANHTLTYPVGYGLDHAEDFRHVPYVASLQ